MSCKPGPGVGCWFWWGLGSPWMGLPILEPDFGAWSPEKRYDTPGWDERSPRGPIICWEECGKGEGPKSFEILLYTSERTSRKESSVWW
jgi:hypothetical protein